MMNNYVFSGTREECPYNFVEMLSQFLLDIDKLVDNLCVFEGGAKGVDSVVRHLCKLLGIQNVTVHANWKGLGKSAGPIRNGLTLDLAGECIVAAFPQKKSTGTRNMIKQAKSRDLITVVYVIQDDWSVKLETGNS